MNAYDQQRIFALTTEKNNGTIRYQGPGWYKFNGKTWQWSDRQDWFAGSEQKARWIDDKSIKRYIQI